MRSIVTFTVAACILCFAACSDSPTNSNPAKKGSMLLSRLAVAVVPGGSQEIVIEAIGSTGQVEQPTYVMGDGSVASAELNDSVLTIGGLAVGTTTVTISTPSGSTRTVPINVYDLLSMTCGELQFKFATDYTVDGYWQPEFEYYSPIMTDGYRSFGSVVSRDWRGPLANHGMMLVKATEGSTALAEPIRYDRVYGWLYGGWEGPYFQYWRPVPPDGYKALGMVVCYHLNTPPANAAICVREDLAVPGIVGPVAADPGGVTDAWGTWYIVPTAGGPHDSAYLAPGGAVLNRDWNQPTTDPVLTVLYVDFPTLAEGDEQSFIPHLTSVSEPPKETKPLLQRAVLLPYSAVGDPLYANDQDWRVRNSPFYVLEREVYYELKYHNYNQTSLVQENDIEITKGVVKDSSTTFYNETSIDVSFEAGINIGKAYAKVSSTLTKKLGYRQLTSLSEFEVFSSKTTINTAPGKAAACWQKYNRLTLYRHHGTSREIVKTWKFGIDQSFVTDEYPN